MARYASIVPAIRTVHGVDVFDYRISDNASVKIGDIVRIPFRTRSIIGMIVGLNDESPVAAKAVDIDTPVPLIRAGHVAADLLAAAARRCFCPRPTVLASWLRNIPKKASGTELAPSNAQTGLPIRQTRYAVDRMAETIRIARELKGNVLVLSPWQERAAQIATELEAPCLHASLATGRAWKAVQGFANRNERIVVTTRLGAWLSVFADAVIIDEPENDDYKQDELTPRLDARWIVATTAKLMPHLSTIQVSTTPAVATPDIAWAQVPSLEPQLVVETTQTGSRSKVDSISASSLTRLEEEIQAGRQCIVLHGVRGERARFVCRDCGWMAPCPNCGFVLSRLAKGAVCRKCGKKSPAPEQCAKCSGVDLSRSMSGGERVAAQLAETLGPGARIIGLTDFWHLSLPSHATVLVTDIGFIGGAVEDIRRKERLAISFRRLAAMCQAADTTLIAQGDERLLAQCRSWLSSDALHDTWTKEISERAMFGYPPVRRMAKLLIDGTPAKAEAFYTDILARLPKGWQATPPLPVPYRPAASTPRSCMQINAPETASEDDMDRFLHPLAGAAIIDLDPIAFFS